MTRTWSDGSRRGTALGTAAVAGGMLWAAARTLYFAEDTFDLSFLTYDDANRIMTGPILVLVVTTFLLARGAWGDAPPMARGALAAASGGWFLLLCGNVLEFWAVLLQDLPNARTAAETGAAAAWWGSYVGWMVFAAGLFLLLAAAVALLASAGRDRASRARAIPLACAWFVLLDWAFAPFAIVVAGGWIVHGWRSRASHRVA